VSTERGGNDESTTRITRKLSAVFATGTLALVLPVAAHADPPGDWPRRTADAALVEMQNVRPDDRADRRIAPAAFKSRTPTVIAADESFDWSNAVGFAVFLAVVSLGTLTIVYSHRRLRST
jgi:hypothetical protein